MPRARTPRSRGFRLAVYPAVNRTTNEQVTRLVLETTQAFATYQYALSVQEERDANRLRYRVLGLHAPANLLPGAGPARFLRDYSDLSGIVEIQIEGIDRRTVSCTFDVTPARVRIVKSPPAGTLEVLTEPLLQQLARRVPK